jgi:hypothetical protein
MLFLHDAVAQLLLGALALLALAPFVPLALLGLAALLLLGRAALALGSPPLLILDPAVPLGIAAPLLLDGTLLRAMVAALLLLQPLLLAANIRIDRRGRPAGIGAAPVLLLLLLAVHVAGALGPYRAGQGEAKDSCRAQRQQRPEGLAHRTVSFGRERGRPLILKLRPRSVPASRNGDLL